jgi:copper chaperone CopZ
LQTTVLRVSIHCEGCKKKVKKVLHNIEGRYHYQLIRSAFVGKSCCHCSSFRRLMELLDFAAAVGNGRSGVYRVTVDAAQHKVTVTASVGADALVRRLHKAGKQAALWPAPATAPPAAAKKPEEVAPPPPPPAAVEGDKADAKTKEAAKDKNQQPEAEGGKVDKKKPEKDKGSSDKKSEKAEAAKPKEDDEPENKDVEVTPQPKVTEPAKASAAAGGGEEAGAEEPSSGGKKGKKKKNKQQQQQQPKEGGEPEAAPAEKAAPQPSMPPAALPVVPSSPAPPPPPPGPERPLGGGGGLFPYYAAAAHAPVVMSYNVAHPSSSVSYYAPTPVGPSPAAPPPPQHQVVPYGYPPMVMVPEFVYGPPGVRSSPPQESYNNMFNEENANSCSVM